MREKYTADAKETLVLAEKAASQAGCSYVGSEHILLGLLKGKGVAASVLSANHVTCEKVEELMEDLKKKYTVVVVTHNMQQATRVSDETAFFLVGEVVEFDKTETIFSNPKNKKTEDYITGRFG